LTAVTVAGLATALTGLLFTIGGVVGAAGLVALVFGIKKTGAQLIWAATKGVATFTWSLVRMSVMGIARAIPALASMTAHALVAAAPFLVIAAAVGAVTLAIIELVKHWKELDVLEGLKGIVDSVKESGVLSTLGELFDPRALLEDIGLKSKPGAEKPAAKTVNTPSGKAQRTEVGGTIHVQVEGPARIASTSSAGPVGLSAAAGMLMPVGG
jgi:hypothetical protein